MPGLSSHRRWGGRSCITSTRCPFAWSMTAGSTSTRSAESRRSRTSNAHWRRRMSTMTEVAAGTHVYRVYIKATPEQIWEAITSPEWNYRYGFGAVSKFDLRPGGKFQAFASDEMKAYDPNSPDVMVDGEVIEVDPPRLLVQTYRFLWSPELIEEGFTRITYEL